MNTQETTNNEQWDIDLENQFNNERGFYNTNGYSKSSKRQNKRQTPRMNQKTI